MNDIVIYDSTDVRSRLDEDDMGNKTSDIIIGIKYWLDGPIGFSLSILGLILNLVAIVALARQRVQRTFHLLMIHLSCWDFMYLNMSIICFALPILSQGYRDFVFIHLIPYVIPIAQICLSASCYCTIALTIERYIAVCAPFFRLRHKIKARAYILPILIFAPCYNVPRFFEFRTINNVTYSCQNNSSFSHLYSDSSFSSLNLTTTSLNPGSTFLPPNETLQFTEEDFLNKSTEELKRLCHGWNRKTAVELEITDFRRNPTYVQVYVNYVNLAVNLLFPTCLLTVMNCLIYRALQQNQKMGSHLRRSRGGKVNSEEALRKRDIRLTRISIMIVAFFIMCHLPRFIPNVVELFIPNLPGWFAVLISLNNVLQIVNSTVNYVIYFSHCYRRPDKSNIQASRIEEVDLDSKPTNFEHSVRRNRRLETSVTFL